LGLLAVNAGSSTLKFGFFDEKSLSKLAAGNIDLSAEKLDPAAAFERAANGLGGEPVRAVGHRVVHGGERFRESVRLESESLRALSKLSELAPLHNPPALRTIEASRRAFPEVPQVAVFDTAYFAALPPRAFVYPLPWEWFERWRIRRFGFHGISHQDCSRRAAEALERPGAGLRVVSVHLGNGCSATASLGGRAVATTMGFTPLEGLMMGSRPGSVDPGILVEALRRGLSADELDDVLQHRCGLLGVSGVSSDFRKVEEAARSGNERAALALEIYADRARSAVAGLAATLGGLDALVFTGGVGENSASLRAAACRGLECLGVQLDAIKNETSRPDADIGAASSSARVLVLAAREELAIARETRRLVMGL
jgi:acetate kinase